MSAWGALLAWRRDWIETGEFWRLITGHLAHYSLAHAALNLVGAAFVLALYGRRFSLRAWVSLVGVAIVIIDVGLQWFTDVTWYVGASGVLHAMMTAGIVHDLRRRERYVWVVAILGVAKIVYENYVGAGPWMNDGMRVIGEAHLFGVLAGALWVMVIRPPLR